MGETIEFSHITERLFRGYEEVENYFLATAEKAYLDTLYYGRNPEKWGELEKDLLDRERLYVMADKFPSRIRKQAVSSSLSPG